MELLTTIILTIAFILGAIPLFQRYQKWSKKAAIINKIPGSVPIPILGTTYKVFGVQRDDIFPMLLNMWKTFPGIHRVWIGSVPEVRIAKAEYVEKILKSTKHIEKSYIYDFIKPWLGDGLLISKGERWHKHRKIITPTFHFNILDGFCDVFAEQSEVLVQKLGKHADTGLPVDVCPFITTAALDIICETAMGTKIHAQDGTNSEYVHAVHGMSEISVKRFFRPWLHNNFIFNLTKNGQRYKRYMDILHGFTAKVIAEKKASRKSNGIKKAEVPDVDDIGKKKRQAFLDLLLDASEDGSNLTTDDLQYEVDTFMFEGHDTTTAGIGFTLYSVGLYPDIEEKIAEEMASIFGDSDRPATIHDLNEMKYLERVIKESMRMHPPVPIIGRITSEEVEIGGYQIPKDCYVGIHIAIMMRDFNHFPNPAKFDPERFTTENSNNRHPYAYIPFSAGPRNCIGQKFALLEEKAMLSAVLRKYRVKSVQRPEDMKLRAELILRTSDGLKLTFEKR